MNDSRTRATIAACIALSAVLGTIHAFSVFIPQWESLPNANRASVSLVYSLALVSLTIAVLFGHMLYKRLQPFLFFAIVGVLAALGLILSARSSSLISLYLSYGLIFGGANGLGYGYALQLSGQAAPNNRGLAMGLVTAFYAVGATVAPVVFIYFIKQGGNSDALSFMSLVVLLVALASAVLVRWSAAHYQGEPDNARQTLTANLKRARILLWVGYGSAVTAGLMVIGHAFGIAKWMHLDAGSAAWATTVVAFGNMLGGFSAGYYSDRLSSQSVLRWLPLFTSVGLLLLMWPMGSAWIIVFIALGIVGYCYGAIIAVYPVAVADVFGSIAAPRLYGQVFTAWGLAGLLGPWISGWLFDLTGSYSVALMMAVALSAVSMVAIRYCT